MTEPKKENWEEGLEKFIHRDSNNNAFFADEYSVEQVKFFIRQNFIPKEKHQAEIEDMMKLVSHEGYISKEKIDKAIIAEILIAQKEGQPTSRLTSLLSALDLEK